MDYSMTELERRITSLDGKPASSYRELLGSYTYDDFLLVVEYVPDAPQTSPARLRARMKLEKARFPKDVFEPKIREIAARDFLVRAFADKSAALLRRKSVARFSIDRPGQEILETSAVVIGEGSIEIRFTADLPTAGRKISADTANELFLVYIPRIITDSLMFDRIDSERLAVWLDTAEDADALRRMLPSLGLAAFIADRSMLVRRSGDAASINSPDELAVELELPNRGNIRGMGIPKGITVITGGGGAGKSAILHAIAQGVYNHVPGDGRELTVAVSDAIDIRTDEGRIVTGVDLSPFFQRFPGRIDPRRYTTPTATAVVSQVTNLMEALDTGTSLLIIDEDTTAAPLIGRDVRMQQLVPESDEPYRTFLDILPVLREREQISAIIGLTGCGDYLDIADTVILMNGYRPQAVTKDAKKIAAANPCRHIPEKVDAFPTGRRCPLSRTLAPSKDEQGRMPLRGRGIVQYGDEFIDLSRVTQLINQSQARGISRGMAMVHRLMDSSLSLRDAIAKVMRRIDEIGLDTLSNRTMGDLAAFRPHELAAAINRLRNLDVK